MSQQHLGWFRVHEGALQKLRDTYDRQATYRLALLVYFTLCRIANLAASDIFTRRIASIGSDAGLSYNSTVKGIKLVESAGLVTISGRIVEGTKERAPSEYHLIRPSPTEWGTFPTKNGRLPESENSQDLPRVSKNCTNNFNQEPLQERAAAPRAPFIPPTVEQARAEAESLGMAADEGSAFLDHHQAKGWLIGKSPMKDWHAAMRTWHRNHLKFKLAKPVRSKPIYEEVV